MLRVLVDERDEAQYVVGKILEGAREEGRPNGQVAVFYRTNAQCRAIEEELLKYDIPYVVVGGVRFYDRAEVKDALAIPPPDREPARRSGAASHRQQACAGHRQDDAPSGRGPR